MRHFTLAAFAVAALYVVGGCGNGNKVSLDGGGDMGGGGQDFASGGGDMTVAKGTACGKCTERAALCIFECYADVDCAQPTHQDGTPATCDTTTNQCM